VSRNCLFEQSNKLSLLFLSSVRFNLSFVFGSLLHFRPVFRRSLCGSSGRAFSEAKINEIRVFESERF
jgi:hypothetical protein